MTKSTLRRLLVGAAVLIAAGATATALASTSSSAVTRARLERDLPGTFANLYVQQARILGRPRITVASLHAKAQCDKGGPKVADHGPGTDWICLMSWDDPNVPLPDGSGKFELNVHSNACYTAGGPSKLIGQLTITDTKGDDVPNPVFEFDGCFDPHGDNTPTGVEFPKLPSTTTPLLGQPAAAGTPAVVSLGSGPLRLHDGVVAIPLTCSAGDGGCAGTLRIRPGAATATYVVAAGSTTTLNVPLPRRASRLASARLAFTPVIGRGPSTLVETSITTG